MKSMKPVYIVFGGYDYYDPDGGGGEDHHAVFHDEHLARKIAGGSTSANKFGRSEYDWAHVVAVTPNGMDIVARFRDGKEIDVAQ
jgi:hypothetical protein